MSRDQPVLRIVRGDPSAEELAALAALVTAAGGREDEPAPARGRWNDPAHSFRQPLRPGPGAWRATTR